MESRTAGLHAEWIYMDGLPVATVRWDGHPNGGGDPEVLFIHTDHLGTARYVTDTAGELRAWTLYSTDPFKIRWGGLNFELGFPGQYNMVEVPYWYNWHRDYMPEWGRYWQADPIGLDAGTNSFQSVGANPLRYIDPDGLDIVVRARAGATMRSAPIPHVSSGTTDRGVLRGFHPKSELAAASSLLVKGIVGFYPPVPGELRPDDPAMLPIKLVIPTSRQQDLAYERCLDTYDDSRYSPLGRNCTDPVETCLREIGFDVTDSVLPLELVRQLRGYKKTRRGIRPPR